MRNNKKNVEILKSLDYESRKRFLAGGRPSVGAMTQVTDHGLVKKYTARIRGITIQVDKTVFFDTYDEAMNAAQRFADRCSE